MGALLGIIQAVNWQRSNANNNQSAHILWGYLEEEPKHLVESIAQVAETYENTKKIIEARYGE
jgi:hypothetical protein